MNSLLASINRIDQSHMHSLLILRYYIIHSSIKSIQSSINLYIQHLPFPLPSPRPPPSQSSPSYHHPPRTTISISIYLHLQTFPHTHAHARNQYRIYNPTSSYLLTLMTTYRDQHQSIIFIAPPGHPRKVDIYLCTSFHVHALCSQHM